MRDIPEPASEFGSSQLQAMVYLHLFQMLFADDGRRALHFWWLSICRRGFSMEFSCNYELLYYSSVTPERCMASLSLLPRRRVILDWALLWGPVGKMIFLILAVIGQNFSLFIFHPSVISCKLLMKAIVFPKACLECYCLTPQGEHIPYINYGWWWIWTDLVPLHRHWLDTGVNC